LEVRQDLIGDAAGISAWAALLAPIFAAMNADPALHGYDVHLGIAVCHCAVGRSDRMHLRQVQARKVGRG
ncbi:hypothetical protein AB9F35_35220, partial [Rhizobium leguminosarum]